MPNFQKRTIRGAKDPAIARKKSFFLPLPFPLFSFLCPHGSSSERERERERERKAYGIHRGEGRRRKERCFPSSCSIHAHGNGGGVWRRVPPPLPRSVVVGLYVAYYGRRRRKPADFALTSRKREEGGKEVSLPDIISLGVEERNRVLVLVFRQSYDKYVIYFAVQYGLAPRRSSVDGGQGEVGPLVLQALRPPAPVPLLGRVLVNLELEMDVVNFCYVF